jgi:hypothetical protein
MVVTKTNEEILDGAMANQTITGLPLPDGDHADLGAIALSLRGYSELMWELLQTFGGHRGTGSSIALQLIEIKDFKSPGDLELDDPESIAKGALLALRCIDEFVVTFNSGETGIALLVSWDRICDASLEAITDWYRTDSTVVQMVRSSTARLGAQQNAQEVPMA